MKVSCLQENLARGLSVVSRAVAARSTLPVLGNVLIATDQGRLKIAATNLELAVSCWIGAKVDEDGATTIPARTLIDFVNSLPPERIDLALNVKTQTLHLKCARYDANIKGIDASEFPIIPTLGDGKRIELEPEILREMIEQVSFAAATDESRPVLTGVIAKFEKDKVTFAAADGFRLSVRHATLTKPLEQPVHAIIPAKALQEVGRVSGDQEEPIEISVTENRSQALFRLTNIEIVSQLVDGIFPDFTRIIPESHTTRTTVNTAELQSAVKASSVFAREAMNTVRLQIAPAGEMGAGKMTITAASAESGDNLGEIDATVDGEPVEIAFNARYLADVLGVLHTPQVALETSGSASPGVIKAVGRDDFTHVIMPMHINK
ncbi:MAG: DNA polymerase III subunit beta [Chloroflexi bacterium]|nr:DNA polymerase III subunit beta [Chloroflexota bacterium]